MKIMVTGSNGFIGKHVCNYLREQGCYVVGLGKNTRSKTECDEYLCCDLFSDKVTHIFDETKIDTVDAIVHLASDMRHEPYEVEVVANNCTGMQRLIELSKAKKIPVFIQLSSLPVIGTPKHHPITEEHPIHPPTVYHATKYMQEILAEYANYTHGLRTVSFRICSPVGDGDNPNTIFPTFVRKALSNEDIVIYGKGTRKQTYIHVKDIAIAIWKAINTNAQGVYNLASNNLISNLDLAKKCIELTNSSSKIIFSDIDDPLDEVVWDISIERLISDTGFNPTISIDDAILDVANAMKRQAIKNEKQVKLE